METTSVDNTGLEDVLMEEQDNCLAHTFQELLVHREAQKHKITMALVNITCTTFPLQMLMKYVMLKTMSL
jgi:Tfp pilus assembly PilM family ATPase